MEARGALSSLVGGSLPPPRGKELSSRKKLSSLAKSNLVSVLLVSEDEVKGSPLIAL